MKQLVLVFLLWSLYNPCFCQLQKNGFDVTYSNKDYYIYNGFCGIDKKMEYYDFVEFLDWRFVDSLRIKLKEFYDLHFEYDTLNMKLAGIIVNVDTAGRVVRVSLSIPQECARFYSLETLKKLNELLVNYRFNLSDYKRPVLRVIAKSEKQMRVDTFDVIEMYFSVKSDGSVGVNWDDRLKNQIYKMLIDSWKDIYGQELIFYPKNNCIFVRMIHPLADVVGDYPVIYKKGMLYIDFGDGKEYPLTYKFAGDRLTLSGDIAGKPVKWDLTRLKSIDKD